MVKIVKREFDAIIIGGGAAGMAAAARLSRAGRSCIMLEARNRLGGRVFSTTSEAGYPVELGAEFIHGKPAELMQLADQGGIPLCADYGEQWIYRDGKLTQDAGKWEQVGKIFAKMDEEEGAEDRTFAEFLSGIDVGAETKAAATRYAEGFNAADAGKLSVQGLILSNKAELGIEGDDTLFRSLTGYDKLIELLMRDIDEQVVKLDHAVRVINWRSKSVNVICQTAEGETYNYSGKTAIITLPLAVLQARGDAPNMVRFLPALKGKRNALAKLVMGKALRLTLVFNHCFWETVETEEGTLEKLNFLLCESEFFPTWWTQWPMRVPILVAWGAGKHAERLEHLTQEEMVARAIDTLSGWTQVKVPQLMKLLRSWHVHDWQQDQFSMGAYSYPAVGGVEAQKELAEPVEQTLFFAGEATDTEGHFGTVHGAIRTGYRAADQVLDSL